VSWVLIQTSLKMPMHLSCHCVMVMSTGAAILENNQPIRPVGSNTPWFGIHNNSHTNLVNNAYDVTLRTLATVMPTFQAMPAKTFCTTHHKPKSYFAVIYKKAGQNDRLFL
jgi:hypothetical protein